MKALDLSSTLERFFENLVLFNQSDEQKEKEHYFEEMQKIKKQSKFVPLNRKQSTFYEKNYYAIIRELAVNSNWDGSYEKLASYIVPSITTKEAEDAVEMLVETGILKEKRGKYHYAKENIDDSKVAPFLKKRSRREVFERSVEVLDEMSPDKRFALYSTFITDEETYEEINELFLEFRERANELIMNSKSKKNVYQMTFGNFPASRVK